MSTTPHFFHWIVALEGSKRFWIKIDGDIAQCGRLTPHYRTAAEVCFNISVMRRHHGDEGLT
jgi:hypothetical protein